MVMTIDDETLKRKRCVNQLFPYCLCRGKQTFLKIAIKNTCDKLFSDLEKSKKYLDNIFDKLFSDLEKFQKYLGISREDFGKRSQ